jgi:hypothetical protein
MVGASEKKSKKWWTSMDQTEEEHYSGPTHSLGVMNVCVYNTTVLCTKLSVYNMWYMHQ